MRSSGCSTPMDSRMVASLNPIALRTSAGTPECVVDPTRLARHLQPTCGPGHAGTRRAAGESMTKLYGRAIASMGLLADFLLAGCLAVSWFLLCGIAVLLADFSGFAVVGNVAIAVIFGSLVVLMCGALRLARKTGYAVGHRDGSGVVEGALPGPPKE